MILNGEHVTEIKITRADGHLFNILNWSLSDMPIEQIAWNLAHINRYGGAQPRPVSVALHSVLVSHLVSDALSYEALMHDATEAFVGDMMHPIKAHCPEFKAIEDEVRKQVVRHYSLPRLESLAVKTADLRARELECLYRRGLKEGEVFDGTLKEYAACEFFLAPEYLEIEVVEIFLARYDLTRQLAQNWS